MLFHCSLIWTFWIARIGFEEKPWIYVVYFEFYMDLVFFIDIIRIFTTPTVKHNGTYNRIRKEIAKQYIKTWFAWDVFAFYPLAYLRYNSRRIDGSLNDIQNFLDQNYERLPRYYKIMLAAAT